MRIRKLSLFTNTLEQEKVLYTQTLGFTLLSTQNTQFTVKVGWTVLTFIASERAHHYHYCFLIPSNMLNEGLAWLETKVSVLEIAPNQKIQQFEGWNAKSFYFYDASGNIAEFIVRYDLENNREGDFSIDHILGVNEIGMPTADIVKSNNQLEKFIGTKFWKGDLERFGTHGDLEGLLLLPNYTEKKEWYPTTLKITQPAFNAVIENKQKFFQLDCSGKTFSINTYSNEDLSLKVNTV